MLGRQQSGFGEALWRIVSTSSHLVVCIVLLVAVTLLYEHLPVVFMRRVSDPCFSVVHYGDDCQCGIGGRSRREQ